MALQQEQRQERSGFRKALSRFVAPQHQVHAEQEQENAVRMGGTPIAQLQLRQRAQVCGTLRPNASSRLLHFVSAALKVLGAPPGGLLQSPWPFMNKPASRSSPDALPVA